MQIQLKDRIIKGLFWRFLERCGAQGISFVVSIILARILEPSEFGIIALITVFTNILMVFTDSGLGQALVQKAEVEEADYSSALWMNSLLAVVLYMVMFCLSPVIARFYRMKDLIPIIRVLSFNVVIGGVKGILQAHIQRNMQFKKFFFATLIGTVISAFMGIYMALHGAGVWALVLQQLANQAIDTFVLWLVTPCRFSIRFSYKRIKELYSFGGKILFSHFIDQIYNNMYSLVIGKAYSETDLAYYDKGKQFPFYLINNINNSINMVIFPALSSLQSDKEKVRSTVRKSLQISSFLIFPMMTGLGVIASDFIHLLLTDKWIQSVPFLRFCCFTYALTPLHTTNLQAISALGKSGVYLKLEIKKKVVGVLLLAIMFPYGLYAMMVGTCICDVWAMIINMKPNKILLGYGIQEQIRDLLPIAVVSVIMGGIVWGIGKLLAINLYLKVFVQIITGCMIYLGLSKILRFEAFEYLIELLLMKGKQNNGIMK